MRKFIAVLLAGIMIMSATPVYAQTIDAFFGQIKLVANGNPIDPGIAQTLLYNGRTYIPLSAAAGVLGQAVSYDAESETVYIGNVAGAEPPPVSGKATTTGFADNLADKADNKKKETVKTPVSPKKIEAVFGQNKLMVNGKPIESDTAQTLLYNDTIYIPLRAAVSALNEQALSYDAAAKTVYLGEIPVPSMEPPSVSVANDLPYYGSEGTIGSITAINTNGKIGVVDKNGKQVLPCQFDFIQPVYPADNYMILCYHDASQGFLKGCYCYTAIDKNGHIVISNSKNFVNNYLLHPGTDSNDTGLVIYDGNDTIIETMLEAHILGGGNEVMRITP